MFVECFPAVIISNHRCKISPRESVVVGGVGTENLMDDENVKNFGDVQINSNRLTGTGNFNFNFNFYDYNIFIRILFLNLN